MIQVINRALDILEYLSKNKDGRNGLKDISTELNLNAGTCANIIKTLLTRKYIVKDPRREYLLGPMAYRLTGKENYKMELVEASKTELDILTNKWKENTLVAIIEENTRVVLARSNSDNIVQANTEDLKKVYNTAVGRVLLSKFKETELTRMINKYGLPTLEEWPEVKRSEAIFRQQLKKISKQGYALIITQEQIVGLAVPIHHKDNVVAAVAIYMPTFRFKKALTKKIVEDLIFTAEAIAKKLS